MIITRDFSRIAVLTKELIQRLIDRYHLHGLKIPAKAGGSVSEWVEGLNQWMQREFPGKEDLIVEWVLKSMSTGNGRVEDVPRFLHAAHFYFNNYKSDKFKKAVKVIADQYGLSINPKNLLGFNLYLMEDVKDEFETPEVDPRVHQLAEKLPEGTSMFYNDGKVQIVEVTSPQAACELGRGTKWCTSDEETAEEYLTMDPLYVIYLNGKKTAQLHIGVDPQLMDLRDRPLTSISDELRNALGKTGLSGGILDSIDEHLEDDVQIPDYSKMLAALVGNNPSPKLVNFLANRPAFAFLYAYGVLGRQRFPQGEKGIATDALLSIWYAKYIIRGRWKPGEAQIVKESKYFEEEYENLLRSAGQLEEFQRDRGMKLASVR